MTNETLKAIEERFSCSDFTDELPSKEKLEAITRAAAESPSDTNSQPWRIISLTNRELINEIEDETLNIMAKNPEYKGFYNAVTAAGIKLFYNAPCMILLPYDTQNMYAKFDCGIVSQSITVAAQSLGVASRIIAICETAFNGEKGDYFREKLHFPHDYAFGLAVLLGYAASSRAPHKPDLSKIEFIS